MAVQQHRGGNPWDFADDIGSAVDTALDMFYRDKKDARDEEKYQDNKMLTMFQMEEQAYQQSYQNSMEMMKFLDDPDLQMDYMAGPEWTSLSQNMASLRDRKRDYFRKQGMPEDEISGKTSHLNFNPFNETLKDALAPQKAFKDMYNKWYNPLYFDADDPLSQGYNPNTISGIIRNWRADNPDADYMEFFQQEGLQKFLMDEQDVWNNINQIKVSKKFSEPFDRPIESAHGLVTNIQTVGEHGNTINDYLNSLVNMKWLDQNMANEYRQQIGKAALSGDIGQYKRVLENINTMQTKRALAQENYKLGFTLENNFLNSLIQLADIQQDASGSIDLSTQSDIAATRARMEQYNLKQGEGIVTAGPGSDKKQKVKQTVSSVADNLTTWKSNASIKPMSTLVSKLFADNQGIFGNLDFTENQASQIAMGGKIQIDTPNGQWNVQVTDRGVGKQLGVWDSNGKGFMYNLGQGQGWQDNTGFIGIQNWDKQGVSGFKKGTILSGPISLGNNNKVPPNVPYFKYGGTDSKGQSILLGVNRKGEPVNHNGDLATPETGKVQWKWKNITSGGLFAKQSAREKAFKENLMRSGVKSHGTLDFFDDTGQPLIFQAPKSGPTMGIPTTYDVNNVDFGDPSDVEVLD